MVGYYQHFVIMISEKDIIKKTQIGLKNNKNILSNYFVICITKIIFWMTIQSYFKPEISKKDYLWILRLKKSLLHYLKLKLGQIKTLQNFKKWSKILLILKKDIKLALLIIKINACFNCLSWRKKLNLWYYLFIAEYIFIFFCLIVSNN